MVIFWGGGGYVKYEPEGHPISSLLELELLFQGQCHGLSTHIKHFVHFMVHSVIFQAKLVDLIS